MAFESSAQEFDEIFSSSDGLSKDLLARIIKYVKEHTYYERFQRMLEVLEKGEALAAVLCRVDLLEKMGARLNAARCPYIVITDVKGGYGFLFPRNKKDIIQNVTDDILSDHSNPCRITNLQELKQHILSSDEKDTGIVAITGLSLGEMMFLEEECLYNLDLDCIGEDEMEDKTWRLTLHGKTVIKKGRPNKNIALSFLKMVLQTKGPDGTKFEERNKNRVHYEALLAKATSKNTSFPPVYIIGYGKQFMTVTPEGFGYGYYHSANGKIRLAQTTDIRVNQPDYANQLRLCLRKIRDPIYTTEQDEFIKLINGASQMSITDDEIARRQGEATLAKGISDAVMERLADDEVMMDPGKWAKKVDCILKECGLLLKTVLQGGSAQGYEGKTLDGLKNILNGEGLIPRSYKDAADHLYGLEIVSVENLREKEALFKESDKSLTRTKKEKTRSVTRRRTKKEEKVVEKE